MVKAIDNFKINMLKPQLAGKHHYHIKEIRNRIRKPKKSTTEKNFTKGIYLVISRSKQSSRNKYIEAVYLLIYLDHLIIYRGNTIKKSILSIEWDTSVQRF